MDILIKLSGTLFIVAVILYFMDKAQTKREEAAEAKAKALEEALKTKQEEPKDTRKGQVYCHNVSDLIVIKYEDGPVEFEHGEKDASNYLAMDHAFFVKWNYELIGEL